MTIQSVVIQKLLTTNVHLGRGVAGNHFKIYTYGIRNRMPIIDSDKTLICLRNACDFIGNLVRLRGKFLFVNTNFLFDEIIEQMTQKIGLKNDQSWRLGGFLTNRSSPKKFKSRNKRMILGPIQPPDCVVIFDSERKSSVILEASKLQIPIVGLVDPSMPEDLYKRITYPVPATDSVKFVYLFCNMITKTFLYEQKKLPAKHSKLVQGRDKVQAIEDSKNDCASDEIFIHSYESLLPMSDDPLEIKKILDKLVVVKSDTGLETKMGFDKPKSSIEVCNGLTCLDLLVNYIESLNSKYGCNIPLLLMNKVNTNDSTLKVLENHSNKNIHTVIQVSSQRETSEDFKPTSSEEKNSDSELEVLISLKNSGKLDDLLSQGKEYVLLLKSNNLAEVVDPKILNYMIQNKIEYCMEVMPTLSSNFKDDALHSQKSKFKLQEIARTQVEELQDIARTQVEESDETPKSHEMVKLSDTPNLWLDMHAMLGVVETAALDKGNSPTIKQFSGAIGINVPKTRYLPVKATSDLLLFQSDIFTCSEGILSRSQARKNSSLPSIELGPEFAKVSDFHSRFKSIPSIIELNRLNVAGDVWFGSNITLKGWVNITAIPGTKLEIPDGTVLENKTIRRQSEL